LDPNIIDTVIPFLGITTTLILKNPIIGIVYLILVSVLTKDRIIRISYILLVIVSSIKI
jgi:hypothetical protein